MKTTPAYDWRTPTLMLMIMTAATQLSFSGWVVLIKNFAVDEIGASGREIGIQESIREIPGFLAFLAIYVIIFLREQSFALMSLGLLGFGVAITGYFPTIGGLYVTTFIMSIGFHYYETMFQSLSLQWLPKATAPATLGRIIAVGSFAQLVAFGILMLAWKTLDLSFEFVFLICGLLTVVAVVFLVVVFPQFKDGIQQNKKLILKKNYALYYALTFLSGARRQIFTVFASLMLVEKFGFDVHYVAALYLANGVINMFLAPRIGAFIGRVGERTALTVEYIGLIGVFVAYAFVSTPWLAGVLYITDHVFFAMAIAMKTYFQKIADPADIAPTAGVAFTINHIAAVFIPALFGLIWIVSPSAVFLAGAAMAAGSLVLARFVPLRPEPGREMIWRERALSQPAE